MVKWRNSCFCCQAVGWKKRCWSVSCRLSGLQGSSCSMPLCHRSVCRQTVCHKALVTADQHPSLHPSLPPLHKVTCCYYQHCHTFATLPTTYASSWTRQILCFIGCERTADVLASVSHQLLAAELHALLSAVKANLL